MCIFFKHTIKVVLRVLRVRLVHTKLGAPETVSLVLSTSKSNKGWVPLKIAMLAQKDLQGFETEMRDWGNRVYNTNKRPMDSSSLP